jgi:hypothetical protein
MTCIVVKVVTKCTPEGDASASKHVGEFGVNNDIKKCFHMEFVH